MENPSRILVVDDETRMCESLQFLMERQGYFVNTAGNGEKALSLLEQSWYDLAILDINLPDISGHQLVEHIKENYPATLMIMITGHASVESAVSALKKGVFDYIRKPFEFDELVITVKNALNLKRLKRDNEFICDKLEITEKRYRYLVDNSPDIIYTLDEHGCFTFISNAAERLLGYHTDKLLGKHCSMIIHDEDRDNAQWCFNERRTGERATNGVVMRLAPAIEPVEQELGNGSLTIELKATGIYESGLSNRSGKFLGTHGVARDITVRRRYEEAMIQSEKMLSLGGLAAGMAHEINNPLAGVIQNANVLVNRLTNKTLPTNLKAAESSGIEMEKIYHFMEERGIPSIIKAITDSGMRIASIVENILNFARKSSTSYSANEPVQLIDKILALATIDYNLKKSYDFKSIIIEKEYEDNLPMIVCEAGKIQQVILNILNNGAYAMFENSNGEKPKFILRLCHDTAAHMLQMEIEDNGPGLDPKTRNRIFEPFFTTKPPGIGTGLGLSISYFIITEYHGGTIDVVSKSGRGTNFIIRLPLEGKHGCRVSQKKQNMLF